MHNPIKPYAVLVSIFLLLVALPAAAGGASWSLADFTAVNGDAEPVADGLRLNPDDSGKIYLTLDVEGLDLSRHSLVHLDAQSRFPLQYFLLWKTAEYGEQLFQFTVSATAGASVEPLVVDMAGQPRWEGEATMVGLGVFAPGRREVLLREFAFHRPGLLYDARLLLAQWSGFLPWKAADSNFYTGTTGYREGVPPVPVFAGLLALGAAAYVILLLARGRLRAFDWRVVGALAFFLWVCLDLMWLHRLGGRVVDTIDNRVGKSVEERLLATEDAPVVELVAQVRPLIDDEDARVFIASDSDFHGMLGSYYLSPLNTYWRRFGPELPFARFVRPGDYLLLVRPTRVAYDAQRNVVTFQDDVEVPVQTLHFSPLGGLLRVL